MFHSPFNHAFAFVILSASEWHDYVLHPDEARLLGPSASLKRKKDFCLGRTAAHLALKELGLPTPPPVLRGEGGEPLWPDGIVGSITHCGHWAIAATARREQAGTIGIDLEEVIGRAGISACAVSPAETLLSPCGAASDSSTGVPTRAGLSADNPRSIRTMEAEDIADLICHDTELEGVMGQQDYSERVTMIFSAKEAIFKAFYPLCRRFIDFKEVELRWIPEQQVFLSELLTTLTPRFARGYEFEVGCRRKDDLILSYVIPDSASGSAQAPAW